VTVEAGAQGRRAQESWSALRARIRAIPPQSVGRGIIGLSVGAVALWVAAASWPALAPYLVGGLIAYTAIPLVNALDRALPRTLAAILALLAVLGLVGLFIYVVVPPLLAGLGKLAELIPTPDQTTGSVGDIELWLSSLPPQVAAVALEIFHGVLAGLGSALGGVASGVTTFIVNQTLGILSTVNFVFGLFVLPVWMTTFLATERAADKAFSFLPTSAQPDARAVVRIVDRSAATFLRARALLALLTGLFIYAGLEVASRLGVDVAPNAQVALAALLGVLQLIPDLGLLIGFLPVILAAAIAGLGPGVVLGGVYLGSEMVATRIAETRVKGGLREMSPLLLIPAIVAMSNFGLLWLFLAAPVVGIVADLARYGYRRLGNPPVPAGVIPGDPITITAATAAPLPSAYRSIAAKEGVTSG
jgi:predicted PurR-regulated permease PerM